MRMGAASACSGRRGRVSGSFGQAGRHRPSRHLGAAAGMLARLMRGLYSFLAVTLLATLAVPSTGAAQAGPRTAVVPFEGRSTRPVRRAVERAIDQRVRVIDSREVDRGAADAGDRAGVSELAAMLGADLVVEGRVSGARRAPQVALVVRAADGTELARGAVRYRRGRQGRRRFVSEVRAIVDEGVAAWEARLAPDPEPEPVIEAPPSMFPEEEEPSAPADAPTDGLAIVSASLGLALRNRDASIALDPAGTRSYGSGAYPEVAIHLEARPFANDTHLGRGFFIQGSFGHSVGLGSATSGLDCASGATQPGCHVDTNFARFAFGAGWLAPLGEVLELGVGLTVGYDGYNLASNPVMPGAEYVYIRPGGRGRVRLAQEALVLDFDVAYRGVVGVGAIAESFGEQAGAHGVDVGIGVGGNLFSVMDLGLTWGVRFDWASYFLSFAGPASDTLAASGTESAVRLTFLVGWSFR